MVAASFDDRARIGRIVLEPNRSWTWRANLALVLSLTIVSVSIATSFLLRGVWMILPFSLLEMIVLLGCLHYCVRRTYRQEVLTLSLSEMTIEQGHRAPERTYRYPRFFTRILVEPPSHRWYTRRIAVRAHSVEIEIGSFLTDDDKADLLRHLRHMIHRLEAPAP